MFRSGKSVYLRPLGSGDLPFLLDLDNDPAVNEFFVHHRPVTLDVAKKRLEKRLLDEGNNVYLGIAFIEKSDLLGSINLHRVDLVHGTAWVEVKIDVRWWGKGCGYEAIMILLNYAFNQLNLRKVCWGTLGSNAKGIRCAQKCGFTEDGRMKGQFQRGGSLIDDVYLSVFRENWLPVWGKYQQGLPHIVP